jgi:hypothetical protein
MLSKVVEHHRVLLERVLSAHWSDTKTNAPWQVDQLTAASEKARSVPETHCTTYQSLDVVGFMDAAL